MPTAIRRSSEKPRAAASLSIRARLLSANVIAFASEWSDLIWALVFEMEASAMLSLLVIPVLYAIRSPQNLDLADI